jgi:hypothetical protein
MSHFYRAHFQPKKRAFAAENAFPFGWKPGFAGLGRVAAA